MLLLLLNAPAPTGISTLSLHAALPIWRRLAALPVARAEGRHCAVGRRRLFADGARPIVGAGRQRNAVLQHERSEEHTSELQSLTNLVCRLLLEKKKHRTRPRPATDVTH